MVSVASGLLAALLFARGRADGWRYLEPGRTGAARSFWALPLALPMVVCMQLTEWADIGPPSRAGHAFALGLMAFTVGWLGFAVVTFELVRHLGAADRWYGFISAWNWCNIIQNLLLVFGSIPALLGAPTMIAEVVQLFAVGWALWIEWFAIRISLQVNWLVAVWLVVLDETMAVGLATVTYQLTHA